MKASTKAYSDKTRKNQERKNHEMKSTETATLKIHRPFAGSRTTATLTTTTGQLPPRTTAISAATARFCPGKSVYRGPPNGDL